MELSLRTFVFACFVAVSSTAGLASNSSSPAVRSTSAPDPLSKAQELIASKQWQAAIAELQRVNAPGNANWNNLMGFSYRKATPPDLVTAEKYYSAALAINPKHLGTLEYLGEMRLQQGDLAGAEKQLAQLRKASFLKSEEFKDLQAAIESYKAAGNTYVSKD